MAGKGPNGVLDQVPKRKLHSHSIRKKPLYTNAKLQSPDGQMLSLVDTKHADWYVKKGLAEYISHDPVVVRLNFEPKGRPEGAAGEYYLIPKSNHCVVCGSSESYLKKWIVPHEYRKEFPGKCSYELNYNMWIGNVDVKWNVDWKEAGCTWGKAFKNLV